MPDIDFGQISETLNNKTDRDLRNVDTTAKADAVIDYQEPTAGNNYTWYRKYASGWVEQGGRLTTSKDAYFDITLPVAMLNDMYSLLYAYDTVGLQTSTSGGELTGQRLSTTQIRINQGKDYGNAGVNWQVSGMAA